MNEVKGEGGFERNRSASLSRVESAASGGSVSIGDWLKKRKRKESEQIDITIKSKKTPRSPVAKREGEIKEGESVSRIVNMESGREGIEGTLREWKDEMRLVMEGAMLKVMEEIREQGKSMEVKMEDIRKDIREQDKKWRSEVDRLREDIKGLEKRIKKMEMEKKKERVEDENGRKEKGNRVVEVRVKELEKHIEMKERKDRKRNVIIRRLETREGRRREAVEELLDRIDAKVTVEEVKKLGKGEGELETI